MSLEEKKEENKNEEDALGGGQGGSGGGDLGGLDDDADDTLILISCEESNPQKFEISKKAALMCNLVKSILEGDAQAKNIEIKKVTGDILSKIVEYLKHHNGKKPAEIAKPIRSVKMERIVEDKWDADFINNMSKKMIFQVILGANYMDLPSLLHLGCAKIATLIKGKSPDEIKQILSDDSDNIAADNSDVKEANDTKDDAKKDDQ
jgi:S-phase kinase-associated protein 1